MVFKFFFQIKVESGPTCLSFLLRCHEHQKPIKFVADNQEKEREEGKESCAGISRIMVMIFHIEKLSQGELFFNH